MGNFLATGAYYIQRIKIHNPSTKIMPKIRAMSRHISKYVHMSNDRALTRFLAASETTELLRIAVTGAVPAGKRILDSAQSQNNCVWSENPPSHSLAVQQNEEVDLGYLDVQLNSLSESTPLSLYYVTPSFHFIRRFFTYVLKPRPELRSFQ